MPVSTSWYRSVEIHLYVCRKRRLVVRCQWCLKVCTCYWSIWALHYHKRKVSRIIHKHIICLEINDHNYHTRGEQDLPATCQSTYLTETATSGIKYPGTTSTINTALYLGQTQPTRHGLPVAHTYQQICFQKSEIMPSVSRIKADVCGHTRLTEKSEGEVIVIAYTWWTIPAHTHELSYTEHSHTPVMAGATSYCDRLC